VRRSHKHKQLLQLYQKYQANGVLLTVGLLFQLRNDPTVDGVLHGNEVRRRYRLLLLLLLCFRVMFFLLLVFLFRVCLGLLLGKFVETVKCFFH
jgi:hypothetical protein